MMPWTAILGLYLISESLGVARGQLNLNSNQIHTACEAPKIIKTSLKSVCWAQRFVYIIVFFVQSQRITSQGQSGGPHHHRSGKLQLHDD
jgi:hypothetical protein